MTDWITENLKKRNEKSTEATAIRTVLPTLLEKVSAATAVAIGHYVSACVGPLESVRHLAGEQNESTIVVERRGGEPGEGFAETERVLISVDPTELVIKAEFSSGRQTLVFPVKIGSEGSITATREGKMLSAEDVAKRILEPVLFPDLGK